MVRFTRIALGLAVVLWMSQGYAHAQWGYGYGYGWGGWGASSLQGDMLRGAGVFNAGTGVYNLDTAQARAINANTWMQMNQYWYDSTVNAAHQYYSHKYATIARDKDAYNAVMKRIQENPTAGDITDGDALNAALDQLSDPKIHSSALRMASEPIDAALVRDIPFKNNSEAVTIMMSELKAATTWPAVLSNDRFAEDKATFEDIADRARKEDEVGDISSQTLSRAHALVSSLRAKIEASPFPEKRDQDQAMGWLKALAGLVRLLEKPDTKAAMDELRKLKSTDVGHLLAFMHAFNLRFGPATTPRERYVYQQLYPIIDQTRDRILAAASPQPSHVVNMFQSADLDQLEGKPKKAAPQPPKPQQ